jgi:Holliday junction DNA helicase RuvA
MLGYLKGKIQGKTTKTVILEVNGVGYAVFTTQPLLEKYKIGDTAELYLHTHAREDALELYGLPTLEEIEFFKKLLTISGVGPKSALGVFEVAKLADVKKAIAHGDPTLLTKVSGIGKKTAELIIIKMKDKNIDLATLGGEAGSQSEALDALIGLGYSASDARLVLSKLPPEVTSTEDKIKRALKLLSK